MNSVIFYIAEKPLTPFHQSVETPLGRVWIRAESFKGSLVNALSAARCLDGESLMNSHPVN
jgi:hypothetical protein